MLLPLIALLAATPVAAAPPSPPPLEPAYQAFVESVEKGINARDGNVIDAHMDLANIAQRATEGIDAPKSFAEEFKKGVIEGPGFNIGQGLAKKLDTTSTFKLLRARTVKGVPRALFRVATQGGLNYLDLELNKDAQGRVRVADIYTYVSGGFISETMRRIYLSAAADANQGLLDRMMGKEQTYLKNLPKLNEIQTASSQGKFEDVLRLYDQLPAVFKSDKTAMLLRLQAAAAVPGQDAAYARAIADFEKAFPDNPSTQLIAIDGYVLRKDYDGAVRVIDQLDKRVQDPYLSVLRGNMHLEKGDTAAARRQYLDALAREPLLVQAHWGLIGITMQDKKYKEMGERLDAIEATGLVELADLETVPEYEGFVKSPEYKPWKKRREARMKK